MRLKFGFEPFVEIDEVCSDLLNLDRDGSPKVGVSDLEVSEAIIRHV